MTSIAPPPFVRPPTCRRCRAAARALALCCVGLVVGVVRGRSIARMIRGAPRAATGGAGGSASASATAPPDTRAPDVDAEPTAPPSLVVHTPVTPHPARLRYERGAADRRASARHLVFLVVLLVVTGLLVAAPAVRVAGLWVGSATVAVLVGLWWSSWKVFPAGDDGRGLLVRLALGVPFRCINLGAGTPVRLATRPTPTGVGIVVRVGLPRARTADVPLVLARGDSQAHLTPESLRALAATVAEPDVPGGPQLAAVLRAQADHLEAGGPADESPLVPAVATT